MSLIIGLKSDDGVRMFGDRKISEGDKFAGFHRKITRIEKGGNSWVIGGVGRILLSYKVRTELDVPATLDDNLEKVMNSEIVEKIKAIAEKYDCCRKDKSESWVMEGSFLIGVIGRLFRINTELAAVEIPEYWAIGIGCDYAHGSLGSTTGDPETRLRKAHEIAAFWYAGAISSAPEVDLIHVP